jgi:hypothetical protein
MRSVMGIIIGNVRTKGFQTTSLQISYFIYLVKLREIWWNFDFIKTSNFAKFSRVYSNLAMDTMKNIYLRDTLNKSSKTVFAFIFECCMSTSIRYAHVNSACPRRCCMYLSILNVHSNASCPFQCCMSISASMSMSVLHVSVQMHVSVHAACPYICCMFMSMLHVHVHAAWPCPGCMSMSMLHVHVHTACLWPCHIFKSVLFVHAAYPCLCCMYMFVLHVHVHAALNIHAAWLFPCCIFMSMMNR